MGLAAAAGGHFMDDRPRWALWLPVLIAIGIGFYFTLAVEPPPLLGVMAAAVLAAGVYLARRWPGAQLALICLLAAAIGFAAIQWRSATRDAPVLTKQLGPLIVTGQLLALERQADGVRYLIAPDRIAQLGEQPTPARIRLKLSGKARADATLVAGERVRVRAVLAPPPGPITPGGFDYGRMLWFERIGAVGFVISPPQRLDQAAPDTFWHHVDIALTGLRDRLTGRIIAGIPGDAGVVAAALMTGDRAAIPDDVNEAMKNSGLAHLLSISGLHMGLVAGILFFSFRAVCALIEPLALRYPIKKWAALFAMAGLLLYMLISGASIPTQRSYLMTMLVLAAVVLDRSAISMRTIMLAATLILLMSPESLLGASFQMSFAAVIALVALYETYGPQLSHGAPQDGLFRRGVKYISAMLLSSFVAGMATAPFAAFHFNRYTVYGVLANMLAVPLTGVWVMPCAVAAFILMPFGLEILALYPLGIGVQWIIEISYWVAALPGAVLAVGHASDSVLLLIVGGGLWLCLWQQRWRWAGLVPMTAGLALWWMGTLWLPDIVVEGKGRLIAVRNVAGALVVSSARSARRASEEWAQQEGLMGPLASVRDDPSAACDALGCVFTGPGGEKISFVRDANALAEDCAAARIVIASVAVKNCHGPRLVIDMWNLRSGGARAIWIDGDHIRMESVAQNRGLRPWVPGAE